MYKSSWYPKEAKKLEDEHYELNFEIMKMLAEKGFDKFTVNMALSVWRFEKTEEE